MLEENLWSVNIFSYLGSLLLLQRVRAFTIQKRSSGIVFQLPPLRGPERLGRLTLHKYKNFQVHLKQTSN